MRKTRNIFILFLATMIFAAAPGWAANGGGTAFAANEDLIGAGTEGNPYQIANASQLDLVRGYLEAGVYFKLTADIDLSDYQSGEGWAPIGDSSTPFYGSLDGNGYVITGLTVNRASQDFAGLFGYIGSGSSIINIKLIDVSVNGNNNVGGLVGNNANGQISNSYVTGAVSGSSNTGGLIGYSSSGQINSSFAEAIVVGSGGNIGGLVGNSAYDAINNSFAAGSVTGTTAGGLVGYSSGGSIAYSYAAGTVSGTQTGGLIGQIFIMPGMPPMPGMPGMPPMPGFPPIPMGPSINSSYYDSTATQQSDTGKGVGKPTGDMFSQLTYSGWDFANTWYMAENQYPMSVRLLKPSATSAAEANP